MASPTKTEDAEPAKSRARINLDRALVLVIDNHLGLEVLSHVFYGFGVRRLHKCLTLEEALKLTQTYEYDLIILESLLRDGDGYDFVSALRRQEDGALNRFTPTLLLSAHTPAAKVVKARDCGANFFVAKPVSPKIVMDRIIWIAREGRQFLETDTYSGPDRRFRSDGPPPGVAGRRRGDPPPPETTDQALATVGEESLK